MALPFEAGTLADAVRAARGIDCRVGGVGAVCAGAAARRVVGDGARALVSWGVAAGLDPRLDPGTLVLPAQIRRLDGHDVFETDSGWCAALEARLVGNVTVERGTLVSVGAVLGSAADKALASRSGVAADMESAAIAEVAREHRLAFVAVRAVLDPAGMSLPGAVLGALRADGTTDPRALLTNLARRPGEVRALLRLAGAFRVARRSLRLAVTLAGERLACPG